ncbi:hypothetical protein EI94DRAFT_1700939 [Lactarius quietus]|nr:hypothetical protein EI94DRAFT_1700939 [Lactarius quietus]
MDRSVHILLSSSLFTAQRHSVHFATPDVIFRTLYSYFWNVPQYTQERPAVIRLAEPSARTCLYYDRMHAASDADIHLVVLEVVVAGEQADYTAFYKEIRREWDYLHIAETLTFTWCLSEDSCMHYEVTFQNGADFWCFLWHLTKPLPHNYTLVLSSVGLVNLSVAASVCWCLRHGGPGSELPHMGDGMGTMARSLD